MQNEVKGFYGPNDDGYIDNAIREAAKILVRASEIWSEGHYPHSNAKVMPETHSIAKALKELAECDKELAQYANKEHDPKLFEPHMPSEDAQNRWNKDYVFQKNRDNNINKIIE